MSATVDLGAILGGIGQFLASFLFQPFLRFNGMFRYETYVYCGPVVFQPFLRFNGMFRYETYVYCGPVVFQPFLRFNGQRATP